MALPASSFGLQSTAMDILRCPSTQQPLRQIGDTLVSPDHKRYRITNGIVRFVDSDSYAESFGTEWTTFRRTQLDSWNGTRISDSRFRQLFPFPPEQLAGKRVLEIGCGMGRFLEVVSNYGAEVVGIDLSRAVEAAAENLAGRSNVHVYQADVNALPFASQTFDHIYSFGVLHHTPQPPSTIAKIVPLLKPGGHLTVWLYGRRAHRLLPRPHQMYGQLFKRLPVDAKLRALKEYSKVALRAGRLPGVFGKLSRQVLPVQDLTLKGPGQDGFEYGRQSVAPELVEEWAWLNAFDAFTPTYVGQFVYEEVEDWFRKAGLVNLRRGAVRTTVSGQRP